MIALSKKGASSVLVDIPENSRTLFPNGFSIEKYNAVVPGLVKSGLIEQNYGAPRDGPVLKLTNKALNLYASS